MYENFNIKNVKRIDMKNCKTIFNFYNTKGSFCFNKAYEKDKIIDEVNKNMILYKKKSYYQTFYNPKNVTFNVKKNDG